MNLRCLRSRLRILNFLRSNQRNQMKLHLRSRLRIQNFLRKNQMNWKKVRLGSRPRILSILRKNQRKCIRLNLKRQCRTPECSKPTEIEDLSNSGREDQEHS